MIARGFEREVARKLLVPEDSPDLRGHEHQPCTIKSIEEKRDRQLNLNGRIRLCVDFDIERCYYGGQCEALRLDLEAQGPVAMKQTRD
jgi:hypothetical protein